MFRPYLLRKRYDPDADVYFQAMPTPPTFQQRVLTSDFFTGTKYDGVWPIFDGGNILCLGTAAQCYRDFKVPTRVATVAGSPTFTFTANRGFTGSGAAALSETVYVQNGYIPSSGGGNWTQNSMHLFAMSHTAASTSGFEIGTNGTHDAYVRFHSAGNAIGRANTNANLATAANADGSGFIGICRVAVDDVRYFREGAQFGSTLTTASSGVPDAAVRYLEVQGLAATNRQLSFGCFGGGLTTAQVALLNTRVQTLVAGLRAL